jgi:hypothetical protein
MTLKEKFIEAFKSGKRFDIKNAETIADDFAIGFAEWIEEYQGGTPNSKILKELLEIYKKENYENI